jgi:hypothetical protein
MNEVYKLFKIQKVQTSTWHLQANRQTERFNKSLANILSIYCDEFQKDWDKYLQMVTFAYNTSNYEITKLPPFMIIHRKDVRFSFEIETRTATYVRSALQAATLALDIESHFKQILDLARENIGLVQDKMTLRADKTKSRVEYQVVKKFDFSPFKLQKQN